LHSLKERSQHRDGMSRKSSRSRKWTCDQCGVAVGRIDGKPVALPGTWVSSGDGLYCLVCRRERATKAALEAAPSDSPVGDRARLGRAALIEFEVNRTPDRSDGTIAKTCRTSVSAVAKARSRLRLPEPPRQPASRRAKHREPAGR
jgi:hypothetical protein